MSYYRPDSASPLTLATAKIVSLAGIAATVVLASINPVSSLLIGATSVTTWLNSSLAIKANSYNSDRHKAFVEAEKKGVDPVLPKDPFLNIDKQPSKFTTNVAQFGGGLLMTIATLFLIGAGGAALTTTVAASDIFTIAALYIVGGTSMRVANIAEDAREYATQEHKRMKNGGKKITYNAEVATPPKERSQEFLKDKPDLGRYTKAVLREQKSAKQTGLST